jgi:hypothetical protein
MVCTNTGTGTALEIEASSTEAGSILNGTQQPTANTLTDLGGNTDISSHSGFFVQNDVNIDFEAPSGAQALLIGSSGVNSLSTACWTNWVGVK